MSGILDLIQKTNPNFTQEHLKRYQLWNSNMEMLDQMLLDVYSFSKKDDETTTQSLKRLGQLDQLLSVKLGVLNMRKFLLENEVKV